MPLSRVRIGWAAFVTVVLVCTLASPLLLIALGHLSHENWSLAGNIGQAYGFSSSLLSGLAFLAVGYSLVMQQRESRMLRVETHRAMHTELLRMAIEDSSLIGLIMSDPAEDLGSKRRFLYANLLLQSQKVYYAHSRVTRDQDVRGDAEHFFKGAAGRAYWARARKNIAREAATAHEKRFYEIYNEEYTRSLNADPALQYPEFTNAEQHRSWWRAGSAACLIGAAVCVVSHRIISSSKR